MRTIRLAAFFAAVLAILVFQSSLFIVQPASAQAPPAAAAQAPAGATPQAAPAPPPVAQELPSLVSEKPFNAATAPAGRLYGGPYVTDVTPTSAVINWVLKTPAGTDWRVGRTRLKALKPATTYYYDVLQDETAEGRGQFTTAPGKPADFKFVIYGDTRTRNDVHRRVVEAIQKENPVFVIHNGDLVNNGTQMDLWPTFFSISEPLLRQTAFFPMLGNHERNAPYFGSFFQTAPVHYSFDWGGIHFSILNSDVNNVAETAEGKAAFWQEVLAWLDADLTKASAADFRMVALHHTPFTAIKARQAGAANLAERLLPVLTRHNVSAVFSGHDHNFQHHRSQGIDFIVSGGGGAPLYDMDAPLPDITVKTEKIEHYMRLRVTGRECLMEAVALDGRIIDTINVVAPAKAKAAGPGSN